MTLRISFDPADVDLDIVVEFLGREAYWAAGRSAEVIERSIEGSAVVVTALDEAGAMVGFARMVTDSATFAWLADVFVVPEARGSGVGRAMVEAALRAPEVADVKRVVVATADAHELYSSFGFEPLPEPGRWMAIVRDER